MDKVKFTCEGDFENRDFISKILEKDIQCLDEYLEVDGIRKGWIIREGLSLKRKNFLTVGDVIQLSDEFDNPERQYSTYVPKNFNSGVINYFLDELCKRSSLLHRGMSAEEIAYIKGQQNSDLKPRNLKLCLSDVFSIIYENPDSELRLVACLSEFIEQEKIYKKQANL